MWRIINTLVVATLLIASPVRVDAQGITSVFPHKKTFTLGVDATTGYVPGTNDFLKGNNPENRIINFTYSGALRTALQFDGLGEDLLYKGLYQGLGVEIHSFSANRLLGTPVSVYAYQGAPFWKISDRLTLGYEWQFGAAFGWKHYDKENAYDNGAVSTSVTAHMELGLRLNYELTNRLNLSAAIGVTHYSNGNTTLPNAGVNSINASLGVSYILSQKQENSEPGYILNYNEYPRWIYDIVVYGAWRRRVVDLSIEPQLCPGKFGVLGLQFQPMRRFARCFAAGVSLDLQYDESAGLAPYWVDGSCDENIKFFRPPFGKQLGIGVSAHAEFIMPVFAVNAGLGIDLLSPAGNSRFYQSLTLKTFITDNMFLNVGYRLGDFKQPQNLMLGVGLRL